MKYITIALAKGRLAKQTLHMLRFTVKFHSSAAGRTFIYNNICHSRILFILISSIPTFCAGNLPKLQAYSRK